MTKSLFNEFDAVSSKQWKQKIQYDLNGTDYNSTLIWNSNEGIAVKPFYHADDFNELPNPSNTKATQWKICQNIFVADIEKSNLNAIEILNRGVDMVIFIIPSEDISIEKLTKGLDIEHHLFTFRLQFLSESFAENLLKIIPKATIEIDSIGHLAKSGNWYNNLNDDFAKFKAIVSKTHTINIDASVYQNAGATMVQQLAYALAHANEYLNFLDGKKINIEKVKVNFNVSIGSNYFFEIAKLKALRLLWETLAPEYKISPACYITAAPTKRNKTLYDAKTNLIRTTSECMSAILGGAEAICNLPYDSIFRKTNTFSDRIARNQLLILKNETYFNKVNNPSDGAYYIESLTNQLSEKALKLFKNIENNGGFLKQLKDGIIQRKIKESANKEQQQFEDNDIALIGTNRYQNPEEKMKDQCELYPFVKIHPRKTLTEPIIEKRLAESQEQKRLKNEN